MCALASDVEGQVGGIKALTGTFDAEGNEECNQDAKGNRVSGCTRNSTA